MGECWDCKNENSERCKDCMQGYLDYIDGWIEFDQPTHYVPKEDSNV